ncbi:thioesterase family protein [Bacillus sp. Marseille-Q3570]|uniref:thioesterase family protein n=1 Tax=Bacillus sp. Marseille-Q3570 TaxID=2963522 RepID=UPI0021B6EFF6|nr:thioesterase family protein [Bacillus sp. Marseille-Q3570]
MSEPAFIYEDHVHEEWVDYNGHMNDAAYAAVFSHAVDHFMAYIGLHEKARDMYRYTIFTLETHLCYLKEAHENEEIYVSVQLLDADTKRIHAFFVMKNKNDQTVATSEQMLMGINMETGRPGPFPEPTAQKVAELRKAHHSLEKPKQAGRQIGIKR